MPKSIVLRRNALAWIRLLPLVFLADFMSAPLAVPNNLAVAHVRVTPRQARPRYSSTDFCKRCTRSLANGEGDYATELLSY